MWLLFTGSPKFLWLIMIDLTARQCMLLSKILEETHFSSSLAKEYAIIMDLILAERENKRRSEDKEW